MMDYNIVPKRKQRLTQQIYMYSQEKNKNLTVTNIWKGKHNFRAGRKKRINKEEKQVATKEMMKGPSSKIR